MINQKKEVTKMPRYYLQWETKESLIATDPVKGAKLALSLLEMVKQDMQTGRTKDWGYIPGESRGYSIVEESNESDLAIGMMKWTPYLNFEVKPVLTLDQTIESFKKVAAGAKVKK